MEMQEETLRILYIFVFVDLVDYVLVAHPQLCEGKTYL